jgi:ligand-binding sensor domain-containing protein/serine phosphatase RsbU (regulator of sigma subunit)
MKIKFWSYSIKVIRQFSLMTLFLSVPFIYLNGQTYFFERYGVEQGLGSSKVYSVIQDKNDWIWLGTETGVSRFNGAKFENFSNKNGMATGGVYSLTTDTLGRIWFGHLNGGLSVYENGKFTRIRFDSITVNGDVSSINQIGGNIWITTFGSGAIRFRLPESGDTVISGKQYSGKEGLGDQLSSSYMTRNNEFYIVVPNAGVKKYNFEKDLFETYSPKGFPEYFAVIVLYEDSRGDFWFGTHNGGLYRRIGATGEMKIYDYRDGLAKNNVTYITEDYRGNIWVGTWGGGITVFSGEKMKIFNTSNGLEATSIHCILEDKEKNMIIADHYTGISIFKGDHFVTWSDKNFIPDKSVYAIDEDENGSYWFGTNAGISVWDQNSKIDGQVQFFDEAKNSIGNKIRFIKSDKKGTIWIGTDGTGISRYDLKTRRFYYDTELNAAVYSYFGSRIITALEIDKKGKLWIGNMDRLIMFDGDNDELTIFTQSNGLAGNWITALYCDNENNIWIGTDAKPGLTKYEPSSGKFRIIKIGEEFVPKTITQTADSKIWIGTPNGLLGLQGDSVAIRLDDSNGLLSNNVKLLQPEGDKFLYIGTNSGLNRYNLADSSIASFTKRNGFTGIETSQNASFKDSKGNLWFGTANGVTRLCPGLMPPFNKEPVVHLSSMEVNYSPRLMKENLKLNYKEKTVLFNYHSVNLIDPDAVRYKIMLKGYDPDWKHASNLTQKDYSLSPGHYTFRVKASNSYGYWNEEPVEFSFIIKPPFYQTPWFIAMCLILAALGIVSYIKIRERNLIREKKILEQKVEERTAEVVQKSMEIEEKNRDITASIRYAERIQRAMLPREDSFHETFVLFMPKDIVSGDFYWMYDNGDHQFIAACDCTGHGVPGAFMSIIGHNSLNKVVREYGITRPSAILDQLNTEVLKALMQRNEETINDGMDMTLIAFDKKKFILEFAGAYNPIYVVRKGELFTYKGDRFPIGMTAVGDKKNFSNHFVDIQPGDMIYMCSDGYADQFGTPDSKKYKSGNVKKLLTEIWMLPVKEQGEKLKQVILDWKGELPQVDDIMFIGTKIPES